MDAVSRSEPYSWERLERLFYEALELAPEARPSFLDRACGADLELRREVESLLECSEASLHPLQEAVDAAAHDVIFHGKPGTLAPGASVDRYRVISMLGAGGMGQVYLAEDTRLKRKVALKMLRSEHMIDERGFERFEREAQAASALNHSNILTIYEFGQADGLHFIAAEYIEGPTLRQKLANGPLELKDALEISIQVARALAAAHAAGIIHRDIKPENVVVRPDGVAKVLDFGIAKLSERPARGRVGRGVDTSHTRQGTVLGTAKYMSPEQARGIAVDPRSDVFSLGAVMYEMIAGKAPFEGETDSDLIAEILKTDPPPLLQIAPQTPAELERIITKAITKNRDARYQSVEELCADLQHFKSEMEFQVKLQVSLRSRRHFRLTRGKFLMALIAVMIIAAFALGYFGFQSRQQARSPAGLRTLAVLPFRNITQDPQIDFLGFSLADAVITKLAYISALTVRPSSAIDKYRDKTVDFHRAARELNVNTLLTGDFIKEGDHLRINTQLIDVKADRLIWQDTVDLNYNKLLSVQDRVAQEIITGLQLKLSPLEAQHLKPDQPMNTLAYEYYLRGVDLYSLGDYSIAIKMLERSAAIEPNYGPTWAHLGRAYTTNASLEFGGREQYEKAQAAYEKAIALDPALAEPRVYMANLLTDTGRVEQSVPLLRAALQSSPNNAEAHWELGYAYRFGGMLRQSIAEGERARQLDPEVKINSSALNSYFYLGEYAKFLQSLPASDSVYVLFYRGFGEYYENHFEEAAKDFDRAFELAPSLLQADVGKALSDGIQHQNAGGLQLLHQTENKIESRGVSDAEGLYKVAQAYAVLGDKTSALGMLRQSIQGGFFCYAYFISDPLTHNLRDEPEFRALMSQARQRHEQFKERFFGKTAQP